MQNTTHRWATCSIGPCGKPSVRGKSCPMCTQHLCAEHGQKQFHACPGLRELSEDAWEQSIDKEVADLLSCINIHQLQQHASRLNNGIGCTFVPGKHRGEGAIMGCANYHAWLEFTSGEKWLVRIPRRSFSDIPNALVEYLVKSEYGTLKFLEPTRVPAPRAYGFALESDPQNSVGVNYLLMEVLPGKPYLAYQSTEEQKEKVFSQLADILAEIKLHPVPQIGSLVMRDNGRIDVGPVASNRFVNLGQYGPFYNESDYFYSIVQQQLELIVDQQLYPEFTTEALVYYRALQQDIRFMTTSNGIEESLDGFYLKHVDDKGDHLLVDEEGNITGIVDWQFARCVPAREAFGPSLFTADLNALCIGDRSITDEDRRLASALREQGEATLAQYAVQDGRVRRLHWGFASDLIKDEADAMLSAIVKDLEDTAAKTDNVSE